MNKYVKWRQKISETLAQAQEIPEDPQSTHQQDLIDIKVNMHEKYDTYILGTINHDSFETNISQSLMQLSTT